MLTKLSVISTLLGILLGIQNPVWSQYEVVEVGNGGTLSGKVTFAGEAPQPKEVVVTKDAKVCGKEPKFDESLIVSKENKGLRYVVVSIKNIAKGTAWPADAKLTLDQQGCRFEPHVIVVPQKAKFNILNSDGVLHNIHTYSEANMPMNRAQPKFLKKMVVSFEQAEYIRVNCDVHNWMQAWIVVAPHPYYAVTDENGAFSIANIPAGKYEIEFWHEKLGKQTKDVAITAGGEAQLEAEFGAK